MNSTLVAILFVLAITSVIAVLFLSLVAWVFFGVVIFDISPEDKKSQPFVPYQSYNVQPYDYESHDIGNKTMTLQFEALRGIPQMIHTSEGFVFYEEYQIRTTDGSVVDIDTHERDYATYTLITDDALSYGDELIITKTIRESTCSGGIKVTDESGFTTLFPDVSFHDNLKEKLPFVNAGYDMGLWKCDKQYDSDRFELSFGNHTFPAKFHKDNDRWDWH